MSDTINSSAPIQTTGNLPVFKPVGSEGSQLQVASSLQANVTITDMVAIATAKAEKVIRAQIALLRKACTESEREVTSIKAQISLLLDSWTSEVAKLDTRIPDLIEAVSAFTKTPPTISYSAARYDKRSATFSGTVSISAESFSFSQSYTDSVPPAYLTLQASLEAAETKYNNLSRELLSARSAMHNTGTLETNARAAIASTYIAKTDGGAELLAQLESSIDVNNLIEQLTNA